VGVAGIARLVMVDVCRCDCCERRQQKQAGKRTGLPPESGARSEATQFGRKIHLTESIAGTACFVRLQV
jgi:hypothetical protein